MDELRRRLEAMAEEVESARLRQLTWSDAAVQTAAYLAGRYGDRWTADGEAAGVRCPESYIDGKWDREDAAADLAERSQIRDSLIGMCGLIPDRIVWGQEPIVDVRYLPGV